MPKSPLGLVLRSLTLVLLFGLGGAVQAQSLASKLEDARIAARAEAALAQDEALRAYAFRVSARGGVLRVEGTVQTEAEQVRVAEIVRQLDGVRAVDGVVRTSATAGLEVGPVPPPVEREVAEAEPEPAPEPAEVIHTVRRGDTLGAIARRYGVSVREVRRLNGLRGSTIRVGQRLRVK